MRVSRVLQSAEYPFAYRILSLAVIACHDLSGRF